MQRIIIHWTGGGYQPSGLDLQHYHYVIDGAGQLHQGRFSVEANRAPLQKGAYAAHTLNCNSGSIGIALAAMAGAVEKPFDPGRAPVTDAQLRALVAQCTNLLAQHAIPVTPLTVLTHAEVQAALGIAQRGKWDVTWLPDMAAPAPARWVGDRLRALIQEAARPSPGPAPRSQSRGLAALIARLKAVFQPGRKAR